MRMPKFLDSIFGGSKEVSAEPEIVIISDGAELKPLEDTICAWTPDYNHDKDLEFERAYEIAHIDWSESLEGCIYKIHGKKFVDIKCMRGNTVEQLNKDFALRQKESGKKFLFHSHEIPTFDSGDREWDSTSLCAVFRDNDEIFAIHCNCGYKIPRIKIYFELKKSYPNFERFLELLK